MDITVKAIQTQISQQKALAGVAFFGAFRDGYLAALDILNMFVKTYEVPKCVECQTELSEEEALEDGDTCDKCYERLSSEHNAESMRNR